MDILVEEFLLSLQAVDDIVYRFVSDEEEEEGGIGLVSFMIQSMSKPNHFLSLTYWSVLLSRSPHGFPQEAICPFMVTAGVYRRVMSMPAREV